MHAGAAKKLNVLCNVVKMLACPQSSIHTLLYIFISNKAGTDEKLCFINGKPIVGYDIWKQPLEKWKLKTSVVDKLVNSKLLPLVTPNNTNGLFH